MKTQAWGWLAAAVVAAGLNASYHDGGLQWAHRVADRVGHNTSAVLALATGHADQFLTEARYVTDTRDLTPCRFASAVARTQERISRVDAQFARVQAMSDRQMAQWERFEADRVRMETQLAAVRIPAAAFTPVIVRGQKVVCPRVHLNLPKPVMMKMPAIPEVHIAMSGAGPV
jgi:hypothetical protein